MEKFMTVAEQRLLESLPKGQLLTTAQVKSFFPFWSRVYVSELLSRLANKNKIKKLSRGKYFINTKQTLQDLRLALLLAGPKGAYISFATALNIHHLLDEQSPTIFIATYSQSSKKMTNGLNLVFVALKDKCVGFEEHDGVLIATKAKAAFDSLVFPQYAGGIPTLARALSLAKFESKDWREFEYYLEEFAPIAVIQRFGYFSENNWSKLKPPEKLVKKMLKKTQNIRNVALLDPRGQKKGFVDEKWRVRINTVI